MKIYAFIFARAGSKGLPGKNIRFFNGKPLIAWAIEHAKQVNRINRIIVSTDCTEIAKIAEKCGAEVPFIRPKELAQDDSPEWRVWQHALRFLQNKLDLPDVMVSIPTTAPLRKPSDIENCLDVFFNESCDVVLTVSEARKNPYFNMVKSNANGSVSIAIPAEKPVVRRQETPPLLDITTVAYVAKTKFVLNNNSLFDGYVKAVKIPIERAIDIDTELDFKIAEYLISKNYNANN